MAGVERPGLAARLVDRVLARRWKLPRARYGVRVQRSIAVPMQDGVAMLADHYFPEGASGRGTVLIRTPYGRGLPIAMDARLFAAHGYHVLVQSCRGTFGSGGQFDPMVFDTDDALDTVAWLREQSWFDGRLATYGASYLGVTQWALLVDPPPELRTSVVIAGPHDARQFAYGRGALLLQDMLTWARVAVTQERSGLLGTMRIFYRAAKLNASTVAALPLADAADVTLEYRAPWFRQWLAHPDLSDPFWEPRQGNAALEKAQVPFRLVAGWQDLMLPQTMRQYEVLHERGLDVTLTVGPWFHQETVRGGGEITAGHLDWLDEHLAGETVPRKHQPVRIHVTGAGDWREFPQWPPPGTELVRYLEPDARLVEQQPRSGSSSFTYDPANPTPTVAGPLIDMSAGVGDNRELEARPDVLTFTTPPLADTMEIIGVPVVELEHSRSNPYADVFVRLCDVDARGRSYNVTQTFLRLDPAAGDGPLRLELDPCAHRLDPGHRLRLQISGGSHPQYLRNDGTGAPPGTGTELRPCRHTVHHGTSRVLLPIGPASSATTGR